MLGRAFCWTSPWEAVGRVIETGQYRKDEVESSRLNLEL